MKKELEELAEGMLDRLMRLAEQPERMAEVRAAFKQVAKMCAEIPDRAPWGANEHPSSILTRVGENIRALVEED